MKCICFFLTDGAYRSLRISGSSTCSQMSTMDYMSTHGDVYVLIKADDDSVSGTVQMQSTCQVQECHVGEFFSNGLCSECPQGTIDPPGYSADEGCLPYQSAWRLLSYENLLESWFWDVNTIDFYEDDDCTPANKIDTSNAVIFTSGYALQGQSSVYEPGNAFDDSQSSVWGGRSNLNGDFWIGLLFPQDIEVRCIIIDQRGANQFNVQYRSPNSDAWENRFSARGLESGMSQISLGGSVTTTTSEVTTSTTSSSTTTEEMSTTTTTSSTTTSIQVPENDECQGATDLDLIGYGALISLEGSTLSATAENNLSCGVNNGFGVWYSFVAANDMEVSASTCGSDYDTFVAIYSGNECESLLCENSNDDFADCTGGNGFQSQTTTSVTALSKYYVVVSGYSDNKGNFQLTLSSSESDPPTVAPSAQPSTSAPTQSPTSSPSFAPVATAPSSAMGWRLWSDTSLLSVWWRWDLANLEFYSTGDCSPGSKIDPSGASVISSGYALEGQSMDYAPDNAFDPSTGSIWGGRNQGGEYWIGLEFAQSTEVKCVLVSQGEANQFNIQSRAQGSSEWQDVKEVRGVVAGVTTIGLNDAVQPSTSSPTVSPTFRPTSGPTSEPSAQPITSAPTQSPTSSPSFAPVATTTTTEEITTTSSTTTTTEENVSPSSAMGWRLWSDTSLLSVWWRWDLANLEFYSTGDCSPGSKIDPSGASVISSGYALEGQSMDYAPDNAFDPSTGSIWGGRNQGGEYWIGLEFAQSTEVKCVLVSQGEANQFNIQSRAQGGTEWQDIKLVRGISEGTNTFMLGTEEGTCPGGAEFKLSLILDDYPGETSWEIYDESNSLVRSGGDYSSGDNPVSDVFCLDSGDYRFVIEDSYGDGICCSYGNGSYEMEVGGVAVEGSPFDGIFESVQEVTFTIE